MSEIVLKKAIYSMIIGVVCLLGGIIGVIFYRDAIFLTLSCILFAGMMKKGIMIYFRYTSNDYLIITGEVTGITSNKFMTYKTVELENANENKTLYVPDRVKLRIGTAYSFYYLKDITDIPQTDNKYIIAKTYEDSFIGCVEEK